MSRILVIDDEEDILKLAQDILEREGYIVQASPDGENIFDQVSSFKPDLILLDVILPKTSGLDICRKLKRDPSTRNIKVILFSALGTEVGLMLDQRDKADDYLLKPFSYKVLVELVGKQLRKRD